MCGKHEAQSHIADRYHGRIDLEAFFRWTQSRSPANDDEPASLQTNTEEQSSLAAPPGTFAAEFCLRFSNPSSKLPADSIRAPPKPDRHPPFPPVCS
jgi:hypothetical protein